MNKSRTCSIDGCGKGHYGKGWCETHYKRWRRHGETSGGALRAKISAPFAFVENVARSFEGQECLTWPYSRGTRGYGQITVDGKTRLAHRIVCELEHGPPPTPKHEAAHSCGKGHEGCVNRKHLSWKTHAENQADKLIHGTSSRGERNIKAKLTEGDVLQIRASTMSSYLIAGEFGVSPGTIRKIRSGAIWGHL